MSSKSFCATRILWHFKTSKFSLGKTSRGKFLDIKPTHFAVRIAALLENNRSTIEKLAKEMLYFINTCTKSVDTMNLKNVFFRKLQRNDPSDVVDLRIWGKFQFFYRKSANVWGKRSFRKSANQNLESALCGLAHWFAEVPSTAMERWWALAKLNQALNT